MQMKCFRHYRVYRLFLALTIMSIFGYLSLNFGSHQTEIVLTPIPPLFLSHVQSKSEVAVPCDRKAGNCGSVSEIKGYYLCNNTIKSLPSLVTELNHVKVHPDRAVGKRKGGEAMGEVKGQKEEEEYFRFKHGFLQVACSGVKSSKLSFLEASRKKAHKHMYGDVLNTLETTERMSNDLGSKMDTLTVGISRKDYANMYWTTIELYSAYFTAREMNTSSQDTTILLLDAHPSGHLEDLWTILFKSVLRLGRMTSTTQFRRLCLVPPLDKVSIVRKSIPIPYFDDFRFDMSFLAGGSPSRTINCQKLRITMVVRKNYLAHPRNVKGRVSRQLNNAEEVLSALNSSFPQDKVRGVSFEDLTVGQQVKLSSETDILLGVHGAGLAHTVFQVPGAGLIELFPMEFKSNKNPHFEQLATWSGKIYSSWYSDKRDGKLEVPPKTVFKLVSDMKVKICSA